MSTTTDALCWLFTAQREAGRAGFMAGCGTFEADLAGEVSERDYQARERP